MKTLSICMIVKNEEKYLKKFLESTKPFVDEIILIDTGSKDKTIEIAQKFGCKTHNFKWCDDFSKARNESIKYATSDWILILDADEIIEKEDFKKIKELINSTDKIAFSLDQKSYITEKQPKATPNKTNYESVKKYPFYISNKIVRLFKNNMGLYYKNRVHELLEHSIQEKGFETTKLSIPIHHFGSLKKLDFINKKANKYSDLIIKQLNDEPENPRYNFQAAKMCLEMKDYKRALNYFLKTANLKPNYKLVMSEIAKIFLIVGQIDKAIEYFSKSMHYSPENPSPANNLSVLYMRQGRLNIAKIILEKQLKTNPENKALMHNYNQLKELMKNK